MLTLLRLLVVVFAACWCAAQEARLDYKNFKLLRLLPESDSQLQLIQSWMSDDLKFDVWRSKRSTESRMLVDVLLSPESYTSIYKQLFLANNISSTILNNDIQKAIDEEMERNPLNRTNRRTANDPTLKYLSYNEVINYLNYQSRKNPALVSLYSAGKTYENRDLAVLRLRTPTARRAVWIDCGIHAREWISVSTCIQIIDKLVSTYSTDPLTYKLLSYYEFHILPIVNPDGYEYSHTRDRMWRKNRNPNDFQQQHCHGVDLNRNYDYMWMTSGSSRAPCSDIYAGKFAASELEIQAIQRTLAAKQQQWDAFLTLHSYGQYWFTPWGYANNLPSDYSDLVAKANVAVNAIKRVYGAQFQVGSSANLIYASSGGAEDFAKGRLGIKYAYCLELRPSEGSSNGFILPENFIPIAGEETYQGVRALLNEIMISPSYSRRK